MAFLHRLSLRGYSKLPNKGQSQIVSCLQSHVPEIRSYFKQWKADNFHKILNENVTVKQAMNMRDIKSIICETSLLHPTKGIYFRDHSIQDLCKKLSDQRTPKTGFNKPLQPQPEAVFWLLLTGNLPTTAEIDMVTKELLERTELPEFTKKVIDCYPSDMHPMIQLSGAVLSMSHLSKFKKAYNEGVKKEDYYLSTFEDALDIIAKVPVMASRIYRNLYHNRKIVSADNPSDMSQNFSQLLGFNSPEFSELMRLYLTIHCDHEGGNVSAHACHLVGSALNDPYISFSSAINGLSGPLHGLANQQALDFIRDIDRKLSGQSINKDNLGKIIQDTLSSGSVVPGYGHAVLKVEDPRFTLQSEFAHSHISPDNRLLQIVSTLREIAPWILMGHKKVRNPYPNVDAHSGVLLHNYGLTHSQFFTVLFAISRCIGVMTNLTISRIYNLPIERPRSVTTKWITENLD